LYKLNVYSGPSGQFQKHVDTPRGVLQFGSLVVCLPYPHQGGALTVSHKSHTSTFDWSSTKSDSSPPAIKWAAFYSDCSHEVFPVTTGHRVTLTYNLYVSPSHVGSLFTRFPTVDPSLYPLFSGAREMLSQPGFMAEGGMLAFQCTHHYAHASKHAAVLMPHALKGLDATVFSVFSSLGLAVTVRPIADNYSFEEWEEDQGREDKDEQFLREKIVRVGESFAELVTTDDVNGEYYDTQELFQRNWPFSEYSGIEWLNANNGEGELCMVNMKHGNEASLEYHYSRAAILIDIPSRRERRPIPENGFPAVYSRAEDKRRWGPFQRFSEPGVPAVKRMQTLGSGLEI